MTYQNNFTLQPEIMEQIAGQGLEYLPELIRSIVNAAMKVERQRHLGAAPYERNEERQGHANGYKDKRGKRPMDENMKRLGEVN